MPIVSKYTGLLIDLLGVNKSVGESMSQLTDDLKRHTRHFNPDRTVSHTYARTKQR